MADPGWTIIRRMYICSFCRYPSGSVAPFSIEMSKHLRGRSHVHLLDVYHGNQLDGERAGAIASTSADGSDWWINQDDLRFLGCVPGRAFLTRSSSTRSDSGVGIDDAPSAGVDIEMLVCAPTRARCGWLLTLKTHCGPMLSGGDWHSLESCDESTVYSRTS